MLRSRRRTPATTTSTTWGSLGYAHGEASAEETFTPWVARLAALTHRPVILAEIGAEGAHKTDWIRSLGSYLARTPAIVGFVWFNTTPGTTGATGHYRIDDSPTQVAAFRSMLAALAVRCR